MRGLVACNETSWRHDFLRAVTVLQSWCALPDDQIMRNGQIARARPRYRDVPASLGAADSNARPHAASIKVDATVTGTRTATRSFREVTVISKGRDSAVYSALGWDAQSLRRTSA
jgi:hypothetical protein